MALLSTTGARHDPPLNHNFMISLLDTSSTMGAFGSIALSAVLDVLVGGFTECSGLEMSMTPEEYKEGGRNGAVLKFPARVTWSNLTLRKGVGIGTSLWDWHYGFVSGTGKRRDGMIVLLDTTHAPQAMWYFSRGLPIKYSGPALNAAQNNVAIESIEVAHEGLYQVPGIGLAGAAAGLIGGLVG